MQKVIIDTNVLVSSLIQTGYPYLIVNELFIEEKFQFCLSDELKQEYYGVLFRPRFEKYHDFSSKARALLADIETLATNYYPTTKIDLLSDKDDNKILELAEACKADFIITGNNNDFTFSTYKQTKIVTPKEYWENHRLG